MRSSVFRNANPSNLRGSLLDTFLEGNKDHLLSQARSDLAKRELHIESLNKCIGEQRRQTEEQRLALQDAQYGFVEYRRKQVRPQEECFSRTKSKIPKSELPKRVHRMNGCGLTTKPVRTSTLSDGATNSHIVRNMIEGSSWKDVVRRTIVANTKDRRRPFAVDTYVWALPLKNNGYVFTKWLDDASSSF